METFLGFWENLSKPIIGLSPMDGVTDFACRYITERYGKPHVMFTEFVTVEGLLHAPERILKDFEYNEIERPIVAQIYGSNPDDFYKATQIVCGLGFDGIDINMGCPAKTVVSRNAGAKLITTPELALEIIRATRSAVQDWTSSQASRKPTTYSVKTRIGFDSVVIEKWVEVLLEEKPAAISIPGRTLKQMYKGSADWEAITRAAQIIKKTKTLVLGNGDVENLSQAKLLIEQTGVDGVLIGRSAIGNPWVFLDSCPAPNRDQRIQMALEHARYYTDKRGDRFIRNLGKHLASYLKHFPDAALLRTKALQAKNFEELKSTLLTI